MSDLYRCDNCGYTTQIDDNYEGDDEMYRCRRCMSGWLEIVVGSGKNPPIDKEQKSDPMELKKEDLTNAELTEMVDALGSVMKAQQEVNHVVHERMTVIEGVVNRMGDMQVKILELLAGERK